MKKDKRVSNAREITSGYTEERGKIAQELINKLWSTSRVATEVGVSQSTIEKWVRNGLVKRPEGYSDNNKGYLVKNKEKIKEAKALLEAGEQVLVASKTIGLTTQAIHRWKRRGLLGEELKARDTARHQTAIATPEILKAAQKFLDKNLSVCKTAERLGVTPYAIRKWVSQKLLKKEANAHHGWQMLRRIKKTQMEKAKKNEQHESR